MSKIDQIKAEFAKHYIHEPGIACSNLLVHDVFGGCGIHSRSGMKALVRMLKPKNVLEIGSFHFETANQIAYAMDTIHGENSPGVVDSFDIKPGGCDGSGGFRSPRVKSHIWIPHKTTYDDWKFNDPQITGASDFLKMDNDQIFAKNMEYLNFIKPDGGYDMVYIDGDHSYQGAHFDLLYSKKVISPDAVLVIDDIWDFRLSEVRSFFDDLKTDKWDFREWNLANRDKVQNMGVFLP